MRRRRRRRPQIRTMLVVLAAVAAAFFVFVVGFRIKQVEVEGNEQYTPKQIVSALIDTPAMRNSLLFAWKYHTAREESKTPYLSSVRVKLRAPGRVQIIVAEKKVVAGILYKGTYYYFDRSGYVLKATGEMDEDVPMIYGMTIEDPIVNQKLPAVNAAVFNTMLTTASLVDDTEIVVDSITFDENNNITLSSGKLEVELGQNEYLEEKIAYLTYVFDEVRDQRGTLIMSSFTGKNDEIIFAAETEAPAPEQPEPEANTGSQGNAGGSDAPEQSPEGEQQPGTQQQSESNSGEVTGVEGFQVFDSSGTLRNDACVVGGQVLDAYGNPIDGCYLNEAGHVIDAYMNEIDPQTGWPVGY